VPGPTCARADETRFVLPRPTGFINAFEDGPCSIEVDIFENVKTVLLTRELKRPVIPLLFRFLLHPLIGLLLHHPFATE
jgi:hypothetical protein